MLNANDARKQTELMKSILLSNTKEKYWEVIEKAILGAIERGENNCKIFNGGEDTYDILRFCQYLGYEAHEVVGLLPQYYKPWISVSW